MRHIVAAVFSAILISTISITPAALAAASATETEPEAGFGWLKAESNLSGFPDGTAFALELSWDSGAPNSGPMVDTVREAARRALAAKGYSIDPKSPYVFKINIDMPEFFDPGNDDWGAGQPAWSDHSGIPSLRDQWRVPVGRKPVLVPATIALETTVFNRQGDVLWMATIEAAYHGHDLDRLMRHMVSATVAVVGADAERNFTLSCKGGRKTNAVCLG